MENTNQQTKIMLYLSYMLLLVGIILQFLWWGDASFVNDEGLILIKALKIKSMDEFYTLGLVGSRGMRYGPFGIWFYSLLLLITKDILFLSLIKISVIIGSTFGGLYWLIKNLGFKNKIIYYIPVFLSPYLWFYARNLWDNSLNIPLTLLAVASYIEFVKFRRAWAINIALIISICTFLTHLMALPLLTSLAIHFLLTQNKWILKNWYKLLPAFFIMAGLSWHYIHYLSTSISEAANYSPSLRAFFFSFFPARFYSTFDFSYFLGKSWQGSGLLLWVSSITLLAFPISWYGAFQTFKDLKASSNNSRKDIIWNFQLLISLIFLFFTLLNSYQGLKAHPHYYNASWMYGLGFFWIGIRALLNHSSLQEKFKYIYMIYSLVLCFFLIKVSWLTHQGNGRDSLHYGQGIKNQMEVVKTILTYTNETEVKFISEHQKYFPHALHILKEIEILNQGDGFNKKEKKKINGHLEVNYSTKRPSRDAKIEVFERLN